VPPRDGGGLDLVHGVELPTRVRVDPFNYLLTQHRAPLTSVQNMKSEFFLVSRPAGTDGATCTATDMAVQPFQLLTGALFGFALAQLRRSWWEPLECMQLTETVGGMDLELMHASSRRRESTFIAPEVAPTSSSPTGAAGGSALFREKKDAWARLSDEELAAELTPAELASLLSEDTPSAATCMLGGSNLEGRWVGSTIWPQKSPMLARAESLRLRWTGWRGNTILDIARVLASRKVRTNHLSRAAAKCLLQASDLVG
jgi:hypothetical protein